MVILKYCFQSVNNHNKSCTNNIMLLFYHLLSFWISIFRSHKLYCLKNYRRITWNVLAGGLYVIQLIQFFWCVHNHTKTFTDNIFCHCFIYIFILLFISVSNLIVQRHKLHCLKFLRTTKTSDCSWNKTRYQYAHSNSNKGEIQASKKWYCIFSVKLFEGDIVPL